jgi:hypothetical protein
MFSSVELPSSFSLVCGVVSGRSSSLPLRLDRSTKRAPRLELPSCGKRLANVSTLTFRSLSSSVGLVSATNPLAHLSALHDYCDRETNEWLMQRGKVPAGTENT